MILLGTIGHKSASSFVFELTEDTSDIVKRRLESLQTIISYRGMADFFGISVGSIQHIMDEKRLELKRWAEHTWEGQLTRRSPEN